MNIERLTRLAELLEVPPSLRPPRTPQFSLRGWYSQGTGHTDEDTDSSCGTTACAVGLACLDSWFNAQGLHLSDDGFPSMGDGREDGWSVVEEFFDLHDGYTAHYLFSDESYIDKVTGARGIASRLDVAERIREVLQLGDVGVDAKWKAQAEESAAKWAAHRANRAALAVQAAGGTHA